MLFTDWAMMPRSNCHGGKKYAVDRLGFKKRRVEREEWVL